MLNIKPYWFFVAGLVFVLLFVLLAGGSRKPHHRRTWLGPGGTQRSWLGPGGTRPLFGQGGELAEFFANPGPRFTMFGVDWCPHCVSAKPEVQKLGSTVSIGGQNVEVRIVNPEKEKEAAAGYDIQGYPTMILEKDGQKIKYSGPRTADAIRSWLAQQF